MATQTALHRNAFYILGATVRDDRQRIVALAESRILEGEHDACSKARTDLLHPRARLTAELAWLPGVSPRRAQLLVDALTAKGTGASADDRLPILARANLLAANLEAGGAISSPEALAGQLVEMSRAAASISPADVLRDINEDRTVARFPMVASEDVIAQELAERSRYFRSVVRRALDRLPARDLVVAATEVVTAATSGGEQHAPALIDELIDVYEVEAQAFLVAEAENIDEIIAAIRVAARRGEAAVGYLITELIAVTRNWDTVAQPLQVGLRARGKEHGMSRQVGLKIRSLAVDLFNEYSMLGQARRLTDELREVFAELPELSERLDEDAAQLDELEASQAAAREKSRQESAEWAQAITYRAEIGLIAKDVLSISPDGVSWARTHYPLESITRIAYGGTRHSVNGIPTGTSYTIAFGDERAISVIDTRRGEVFEQFVPRLWKAVGFRLMVAKLQELKHGRDWWLGKIRIRDDGITLLRYKLFSSEPAHVTWDRIHISSERGSLVIACRDEPRLNVTFSYTGVENAHVLDRILELALKKPGLRKLSDLLE